MSAPVGCAVHERLLGADYPAGFATAHELARGALSSAETREGVLRWRDETGHIATIARFCPRAALEGHRSGSTAPLPGRQRHRTLSDRQHDRPHSGWRAPQPRTAQPRPRARLCHCLLVGRRHLRGGCHRLRDAASRRTSGGGGLTACQSALVEQPETGPRFHARPLEEPSNRPLSQVATARHAF